MSRVVRFGGVASASAAKWLLRAAMIGATLATACESKKTDAPATSAAPRSAAPTSSAEPAASTNTRAATSAGGSAKRGQAPQRPPLSPDWDPPSGPSPRPAAKDFDNGKKIVVRRVPNLGCEARVVREWIRIGCGRKDTLAVKVVRPKKAPENVFAEKVDGRGVVTMAVQRGLDLRVDFEWKGSTRRLVTVWPEDAPRPVIYIARTPPKDQKTRCTDVCPTGPCKEDCVEDY